MQIQVEELAIDAEKLLRAIQYGEPFLNFAPLRLCVKNKFIAGLVLIRPILIQTIIEN